MKHLAASPLPESVQLQLNQSALKQSCPCSEVQCCMKYSGAVTGPYKSIRYRSSMKCSKVRFVFIYILSPSSISLPKWKFKFCSWRNPLSQKLRENVTRNCSNNWNMQHGMTELPYGSHGSHETAVMVPIKDDFSHLGWHDQDSKGCRRPLAMRVVWRNTYSRRVTTFWLVPELMNRNHDSDAHVIYDLKSWSVFPVNWYKSNVNA